MAGEPLTTLPDGTATTVALYELGTVSYTVTMSGYTRVAGNAIVSTAMPINRIVLSKPIASTFVVTDTNGAALPDASITVNGQTQKTDANGQAIFELDPGTYAYRVSKPSYQEVGNLLTVNSKPSKEDVMLSRAFTITFSVKDGSNPIAKASVLVAEHYLTTDTNGIATVTLAGNTDYRYTVSYPGYDSIMGTAHLQSEDLALSVQMLKSRGAVTFHITDGYEGVDGAKVLVDGQESTSSQGTASLNLLPGDYSYRVALDRYATAEGHFTAARGVEETVLLTRTSFTVTFVVNGSDSVSLPGAKIAINGQELLAGAGGKVSVENLSQGIYPYTVIADKYYAEHGEVFLTHKDVTVNVVLKSWPFYNTTFTVTSGGQRIHNARVEVDRHKVRTDKNGQAVIGLRNGDYTFTVKLSGYAPYQNTVRVAEPCTTGNQPTCRGRC